MIHPPRSVQRSSKRRSRFLALRGPLRGAVAGLLAVSVLVAGAGAGHAQDSGLPAVLHTSMAPCTSAAVAASTTLPPVVDPHQRLAVPSYFRPGPLWTQLERGVPAVDLVVINPGSGPGDSVSLSYAAQVQQSRDAGLTVLGYVYTEYGARDPNVDKPPTDSTPLVRSVKHDVDLYYEWYGVDGIFFDEASDKISMVPYYQDIYNYVKGKSDSSVVVINPGKQTDRLYMEEAADIIVSFEGTFSSYLLDDSWEDLDPNVDEGRDWERDFPADRFWHLVHATAEVDLPKAIALSKQRNAGWVYVTPDCLPNPWNTLPDDFYWGDLLHQAAEQP